MRFKDRPRSSNIEDRRAAGKLFNWGKQPWWAWVPSATGGIDASNAVAQDKLISWYENRRAVPTPRGKPPNNKDLVKPGMRDIYQFLSDSFIAAQEYTNVQANTRPSGSN